MVQKEKAAAFDMTRMYWLEVDLLLNETTTQEREDVNEDGIDRCSYLHT